MKDALNEALKPEDTNSNNENSSQDKCARRLFMTETKSLKSFGDYRKMNHRQQEIKKAKEILEDQKASRDLLTVLRNETKSDQKLKELKNSLSQDEEKLHSTFKASSKELEKLSQKSKNYRWLKKPLAEFRQSQLANDQSKDELIKDPMLMENFLEALKDPEYWLSTDELQMLAHVHNIRVEILVDCGYENYGCNNQHELLPRSQDQRPPVVIHADGVHYSKCAPWS